MRFDRSKKKDGPIGVPPQQIAASPQTTTIYPPPIGPMLLLLILSSLLGSNVYAKPCCDPVMRRRGDEGQGDGEIGWTKITIGWRFKLRRAFSRGFQYCRLIFDSPSVRGDADAPRPFCCL